MTTAYFFEIKSAIIQYIDSSTSDICVAVAWFTHRELFQAILRALDRKVRVSAIIIDDIINRGPNGLDFTPFLEKGGTIRFMNTRNLLMHNKFCLFDNKVLISGSYNWTYSAEHKNAENIIVTTEDNVCNAFKEQFMSLWDNLDEVKHFTRIDYNDVDSDSLIKYIDVLHDEYESMDQEHILKPHSTAEIDVLKRNLSVNRLNTIVTNSKRSKPVLKAGISLEIVNNAIKPIIAGGQVLPYTHCVDARTCFDNQTAVDCIIRYGNYSEANKNESLVKLRIENLPKMKAGGVTFLTKVTVDTNGYMHIEFVCENTGISKSAVYNAVDKIDYQ